MGLGVIFSYLTRLFEADSRGILELFLNKENANKIKIISLQY